MSATKQQSARPFCAPLVAALVVASAMLMCACPSGEAASGQGAAPQQIQTATNDESQGVSLWYEFAVGEIGFMLDENGELPQSLADWKRKAEEEGCELSLWSEMLRKHDIDPYAPEYMSQPVREQLLISRMLIPHLTVTFGDDDSVWLALTAVLWEDSVSRKGKFGVRYLQQMAERTGAHLEHEPQEGIYREQHDASVGRSIKPAVHSLVAKEGRLGYFAQRSEIPLKSEAFIYISV